MQNTVIKIIIEKKYITFMLLRMHACICIHAIRV